MNKLFILWLGVAPAMLTAQEKQLKGKVITDELAVERLAVENTAKNSRTETDGQGNFTITAQANDTLRFTGALYKPLSVVVKARDFEEGLFVVRIEPVATMLDEVVVAGLTGNLAADSKNLKTMQVNTWFDPLEINSDIVSQASSGGANWISAVAVLFKKKKAPKRATSYKVAENTFEQKPFSEVVRNSYPDTVFTEKLAIPVRFIGAFLEFCDGDAKLHLLMKQNEDQLMEYLRAKSVEFLRLNPDAR